MNYFRTHWIDAEHNRMDAKTKLLMPVEARPVFGANLEKQVKPLGEDVRSVMIEDCRHYLAEEQPERVIEQLLRFFQI